MILNQIKTVMLLALLSGAFLALGMLIGGSQGLTFAFMMALVMNFAMFFYSDKIVLAMYRAQKLDEVRYGWIYDIVQELASTMKLPMPKLWLVANPMANAFATGRNPRHASVAVTSGILSILDKDELRGVLAHELSHIKNRDTLISTVAATLAAAIGYVCNMLHYASIYRSDKDRKNINPIFTLLVVMLMPLIASLLQLAISRSREYLADETGAHSCHDPLALASALEKLQSHIPQAHLNNQDAAQASTAPLFIVNPFVGKSIINLFMTHPPMEKRIARLHQMHRTMF